MGRPSDSTDLQAGSATVPHAKSESACSPGVVNPPTVVASDGGVRGRVGIPGGQTGLKRSARSQGSFPTHNDPSITHRRTPTPTDARRPLRPSRAWLRPKQGGVVRAASGKPSALFLSSIYR